MNRKDFLLLVAGAMAMTNAPYSLAANRQLAAKRSPTKPYTSSTAPDMASRQILSRRPIKRLITKGEGMGFAEKMHLQFGRVMEQNFARVDPRIATILLQNLTDKELNQLAQLYVNSIAQSGGQGALVDVLAHRLQGKQLMRAAKSFGSAPMADALLRVAPEKYELVGSGPQFAAPSIGMASTSSLPPVMNSGYSQFFYYTPQEVYLSFRTAPVGALGITASLYETSLLFGAAATTAFSFGYATGTGLGWLIQHYSPSLWDAIGGTIDMMLESIFGPSSQAPGPAEIVMAEAYDIPSFAMDLFGDTGGDFMIAEAWYDYKLGGGGGGTCWDCHQV